MPVTLYGAEAQKAVEGGTVRGDSAETVYVNRQLDYIRAEVLEMHRPPLNAETYIPSDTPTDAEFANNYSYKMADAVGKWEHAGTLKGNNPPVIGSGVSETPHVIQTFWAAVGWSWLEIQQAMKYGSNLQAMDFAAVTRTYQSLRNKLCFFGDDNPAMILQGILNNPLLPRAVALDPLTAATATDQDLIDSVADCINSVPDNTEDAEQADTCLIASERWRYLQSRKMAGTTETVAEALQRAFPEVEFAGIREFNDVASFAGQTNTYVMMAFNKAGMVIRQIIPLPMRELDIYQSGPAAFLVPFVSRFGPVESPYPKGVQLRHSI